MCVEISDLAANRVREVGRQDLLGFGQRHVAGDAPGGKHPTDFLDEEGSLLSDAPGVALGASLSMCRFCNAIMAMGSGAFVLLVA